MRVTPTGRPRRPPHVDLALGAAAVGVLASALAGCAEAEAVQSEGGSAATTTLSITMREVEGRGERSEFSLTCDPVGGTLPTAVSACANLATATDPFAPVPATTQCLQTIEGPGLISVSGIWAGTPVQAQFSQINSCETDRFEHLLQTLGVA